MQDPHRQDTPREDAPSAEFTDALKKGVLIGIALLVVLIPALRMVQKPEAPQPPAQVAVAPPAPVPPQPESPAATPEGPALPAPSKPGMRLADFRGEEPTADARLVANWAVHTRNHKQNAFVVIDKKDARVYVFAPDGKLVESAPALLGSARGDDSFPGIGDKPLSAIKPFEKTTPAGRFIAEPGRNTSNEDIVWVDYDAAVSMHRIRPTNASERRLERLASLTVDDNRVSFGCVNLPVSFYENVLSPTVQRHGAIVYVLPEVKTVQQVFGAYDVLAPQNQAGREREGMQRVALQQAR
ncbi:hypothetical protein [Ramlibacter pallidus]|uniref:L,D-TPase catalytic domain-containing protein n=1 Tax=Ramlibacter pallidus TaxID=2780087 RepID=A0ABR9S4T9_9BURK|nr:hypothetical protein [Ramlibacter pallidus]MBE7368529.1 hypothetical protein [Ramlibacter pallidus]